jgi:hypothetical protein
MRRSWQTAAVAVLLIAALTSFTRGHAERIVMVLVNEPQSGWRGQQLGAKLEQLVTSRNNFELAAALEVESVATDMQGRFSKNRLVDWGLKTKCRYIIWCDILREDIRTEAGMSLPHLIKQKRLTAYLDVDYRIVDSYRGRILHADRLQGKTGGASSIQTLDEAGADPDLYLSFTERRELFDALEAECAEKIFEQLERIARQR